MDLVAAHRRAETNRCTAPISDIFAAATVRGLETASQPAGTPSPPASAESLAGLATTALLAHRPNYLRTRTAAAVISRRHSPSSTRPSDKSQRHPWIVRRAGLAERTPAYPFEFLYTTPAETIRSAAIPFRCSTEPADSRSTAPVLLRTRRFLALVHRHGREQGPARRSPRPNYLKKPGQGFILH